jgi:hypothetical protein
MGDADFGPGAREIALNNLYPVRADVTISFILDHSQLYLEPSAASIPCQICLYLLKCQTGVAGTALLILTSGNFPLTSMFDSWKHDLIYPNKIL